MKRIYCRDCKYHDDGLCRRHAPTAQTEDRCTTFPQVDAGDNDWCAEGEPADGGDD